MRRFLTGLTIVGAIVPVILSAQSPQQVIHDRRAALITVVRIINTAEVEYKTKTGRYGEVNDLRRAGLLDLTIIRSKYPFAYGFTKSKGDSTSLVPDSASLQLIVSGNGDRCNIAIKDSADPSNFRYLQR